MNTKPRRIAINVGAGFIPGLNNVLAGAALTAGRLGWELVGIRDGFEGLLHPEDHPDGGLVPLDRQRVEHLDSAGASALGLSPREDPFHIRQENEHGMLEEVDRSDVVLERLKEEKIDALISVVGDRGLSILHKLHRKGLKAVCIPRSIENHIAATMLSLGFNSALSMTIEMLDRLRQGAKATRRVAVAEVQGNHSGWLALQAGIAVLADAILIPEFPCDLRTVAADLKEKMSVRRPYGLVVVAEGAQLADEPEGQAKKPPTNPLKDSLSPLASGDSGEHVIHGSGQAAKIVARRLQLLLPEETHPIVLGPWVRGGPPTAIDRQLGLAYGAGGVEALNAGKDGVMVAFAPPNIRFVPLTEAINKVRTVPADSEFLHTARSLGICLGGAS